MALGYLIREGFSGFRRAKLAMSAAVFTITVSLLLLSAFAILFINANRIVESLRSRVEIETFLAEGLERSAVDELQTSLEAIQGVESVRFISKDEAAEIFKREFGEDIHRVLKFNPLPASFTVTLTPSYRDSKGAASVADTIATLAGVDEVKYRKDLLGMLDRRVTMILAVGLGVGACILIAAIFLVANTIRLAIYAKRKIVQTMKLIGATRSFIRFPFMLEGIVQGLLGGILASAVIYGVFEYLSRWVSTELQEFVKVQPMAYGFIVAAGAILGILGSMISIRRFIGESVAN